MSIESIYKNLNRSMDSIATRKITKEPSFLKKAFNESKAREIQDVLGGESNDESEVSLESFDSYMLESASLNVLQPNPVEAISDRESIYGIRNHFGKSDLTSPPKIGCHPDYLHLQDNDSKTETGYVVTMFIDIIGSTKLGVSYSPSDVFLFKNSVITGAIETITAFDGHVHRIMGDAVMAFFRSKEFEGSNLVANSAIDAINSAVYLIEVMEKIVSPQIKLDGIDDNIGIRIGIDIGLKKWVLWSNYGVPGVNEVTATSFYVDIASKLQHNAKKNSIMIGDKLAESLGLYGSPFISEKKVIKDGEEVPEKYVINVSSGERRLKYKQFLFNHTKYFTCLPHGSPHSKINVTVKYNKEKSINGSTEYHSCSGLIPKEMWVNFNVICTLDNIVKNQKVTFEFKVENTGDDAKKQNTKENEYGNHSTTEDAKNLGSHYYADHWEETMYKGIHHMYVRVLVDGRKHCDDKKITLFIG